MEFGAKNEIKLSDLWNVNPSEQIRSIILEYTKMQERTSPPSLIYSVFALNFWYFMRQFALVICGILLYFSGPYFLNRILRSLEANEQQNNQEPWWMVYMYVFGILLTSLVRFAIDGQVGLVCLSVSCI